MFKENDVLGTNERSLCYTILIHARNRVFNSFGHKNSGLPTVNHFLKLNGSNGCQESITRNAKGVFQKDKIYNTEKKNVLTIKIITYMKIYGILWLPHESQTLALDFFFCTLMS